MRAPLVVLVVLSACSPGPADVDPMFAVPMVDAGGVEVGDLAEARGVDLAEARDLVALADLVQPLPDLVFVPPCPRRAVPYPACYYDVDCGGDECIGADPCGTPFRNGQCCSRDGGLCGGGWTCCTGLTCNVAKGTCE